VQFSIPRDSWNPPRSGAHRWAWRALSRGGVPRYDECRSQGARFRCETVTARR
jgi:hypothetical protein